MSRYALICDNVVVRIVEWDGMSDYRPQNIDEMVLAPELLKLGSTYVNGEFIDPDRDTIPASFSWNGKKWIGEYTPRPTATAIAMPPEPDYEVQ